LPTFREERLQDPDAGGQEAQEVKALDKAALTGGITFPPVIFL